MRPRLSVGPYCAFVFAVGCLCLIGCGANKVAAVTPVPPVTPPVTPPPTPGVSCTTPAVTISHTTSGQSTNPSQLVFLNQTTYPQAVCNDGTPGAYVLRAGQGSGVNRWVISLQGGSDCYDNPSCSSRAANSPDLVSTTTIANNPSLAPQLGGLLASVATTNPDFFDANEVQIIYCSSDDWSGAKTGAGAFNPNDDTTWSFQGRAILEAAIADMKANHGLNSATEVMLTGQSAGGVGVYANTNGVAKLVPTGARFVSYSDAAFLDGRL